MNSNDERYYPNGDDRSSAERAMRRSVDDLRIHALRRSLDDLRIHGMQPSIEYLMIHDLCFPPPLNVGKFKVPLDVDFGETWEGLEGK